MAALLAVFLALTSGLWIQSINAEEPVCTEAGFFSYPDSCREYYECRVRRRGRLAMRPKTCKEGNFFDDSIGKCTRENLVVSPARCVKTSEAVGDIASETTEVSDYMDYEAQNDTNNSTFLSEADATEVVVQNASIVLASNATQNGTDTFISLGNEDQVSNETYSHHEEEEAVVIVDVDSAAETELTFCDHMKRMEEYSSIVIGTPTLHESYKNKEHFIEIFDEYNANLERAKNNTSIWRHGESIVTGLKKSYQKATEYAMEFGRKLEVNKKQITVLSSKETDRKFIQRMKDDIKNLKNTIRDAEEALKFADVPQVRAYFEGVISSSRQEITRKSQEIKLQTKEGILLKEMTSFLGFVKDDAQEIADLGNSWYEQMDSLLDNLEVDTEVFAKYTNRTHENISQLTIEHESLKESLDKNTASQEDKEICNRYLDDEISHLTEKNYQIAENNMELVRVIEAKYDNYHKKVLALCQPRGLMKDFKNYDTMPACNVTLQMYDEIHQNGTLKMHDIESMDNISEACKRTLQLLNEDYTSETLTENIPSECKKILQHQEVYLDVKEEETQLSNNRKQSATNRQTISRNLNEKSNILDELRALHAAVPRTKQKMRDIEFELSSLRTYARDLRHLNEGVKTAIDSLHFIQSEFQLLSNTFEPMAEEFQNLIGQANAAESEDEKHRQRKNIENAIDNTQETLKDLQLPSTDDCN